LPITLSLAKPIGRALWGGKLKTYPERLPGKPVPRGRGGERTLPNIKLMSGRKRREYCKRLA